MQSVAIANAVRSLLAIFFLSVDLAGCVSSRAVDISANINDPLESINRGTFVSYLAFDKIALRPVARGYRNNVPVGVRRSIRHFLDNLDSPAILANDILQGRIRRAGNTLLRAAINSTIGLGGFIEIAEQLRLPRYSNDFGKTLAIYGVNEGPYLFVPLMGPTNVRDFSGSLVDLFLDPILLFQLRSPYSWVSAEYSLNALDVRERNIETLDDLEIASVDFYAAIRNISRQARNQAINTDRDLTEELPNF